MTDTGSSSNRTSTRTTRSMIEHADDASAPESPRRRRTRPTQNAATATTATTWSAVKQDFIKTVSGAVAELMEEHGYSRERATGAVLREISDDKSKMVPPQDIEVGCVESRCVSALVLVLVELLPPSGASLLLREHYWGAIYGSWSVQ
jgi:hypothetical protein